MDSSAILKRYISEVGTRWVKSIVSPTMQNTIVVCDLTAVEVVSAFARHQREGKMTLAQVTMMERRYLTHHRREYVAAPLNRAILTQSRTLLKRHKLRTVDAIHLASAVELSHTFSVSITFVTSDKDLLAAATAEGLATDNPLNHP
jgi:uncharacterized protein